MKKCSKLKLCDLGLLLVGILMLASSGLMEVSGGKGFFGLSFITCVVIHAIVGTAMMLLILYHLHLHHDLLKVRHQRGNPNRQGQMMMAVCILVMLSSIIALGHFFLQPQHGIVGAIHGKIGFLFLLICVIHVIRHLKFFFHGSGSAKRQ